MDAILIPDHAEHPRFWIARTTVKKFEEDATPFRRAMGARLGQAFFERHHNPFETLIVEGNILVNNGIQLLEDALIGVAITAFSNANARLGVGDSSTAATASQTDLQAATNKTRVAMDATFPSRASQTLTFKSTFGAGVANYAWAEWAIFNAASGATSMLNRKVESLGTKSSGTWTLQVDITIS